MWVLFFTLRRPSTIREATPYVPLPGCGTIQYSECFCTRLNSRKLAKGWSHTRGRKPPTVGEWSLCLWRTPWSGSPRPSNRRRRRCLQLFHSNVWGGALRVEHPSENKRLSPSALCLSCSAARRMERVSNVVARSPYCAMLAATLARVQLHKNQTDEDPKESVLARYVSAERGSKNCTLESPICNNY